MNIVGQNGNVADVTDKGLLQVNAVTQSAAEVLNEIGVVFRVNGEITPTGANEYFFYLKNTGTEDLAISTYGVSSSVATKVTMDFVAGTPIYAGEVIAPSVNLNLSSSQTLAAEHNMGTAITGLTSNGQLGYLKCVTVDALFTDNISSAIFIPQGKAIALKRVEATGFIDFQIGVATFPS